MEQQTALILDQFTKQAETFATAPALSDASSLELLVQHSGLTADDTVLDVACGAGIVACHLAHTARHVTGRDLTPAMIERARARQSAEELVNVTWQVGEVLPLPMPRATYSLVVSRYAFHHFLEPSKVLAEMVRVCVPGGRIAIVDVTPRIEVVSQYNVMEKLRDPSHVAALTLAEFQQMATGLGLQLLGLSNYSMNLTVDQLMASSFPNPGDELQVRAMFEKDLQTGCLGLGTQCSPAQRARRPQDESETREIPMAVGAPFCASSLKEDLRFGYPTSIMVWSKPL